MSAITLQVFLSRHALTDDERRHGTPLCACLACSLLEPEEMLLAIVQAEVLREREDARELDVLRDLRSAVINAELYFELQEKPHPVAVRSTLTDQLQQMRLHMKGLAKLAHAAVRR